MISNVCEHCSETFETYPSQVRPFCGKTCAYAARRKTDEESTSRYRMVYAPTHPLVINSPYIPEHRMVLWDKIGSGRHRCHHCDVWVYWRPANKTVRRLFVDHLDRNTRNNDVLNLVPSCQSCNNRNRTQGVHLNEPHKVRIDGSRLRGTIRYCNACGAEFVAWPDKAPNKGRYCSMSCARKG